MTPEYDERWIFIDGERSVYKVRNNGQIISTEYQGKKRKKEKVMDGGVDSDGYHIVTLTHNHIKKTYKVHRLVAMYFIPNPLNKPAVNHTDGNKLNNSYLNLEWSYNYENTYHAMTHRLKPYSNNLDEIELVCSLLETNEYSAHEISNVTGVSVQMVYRILRREVYEHISEKYNIDNYKHEDHPIHWSNIPMSDEEIVMICDEILSNKYTMTEIAKKHNVSNSTIRRIINQETRRDITCQYSFNEFTCRGINQFKTLGRNIYEN